MKSKMRYILFLVLTLGLGAQAWSQNFLADFKKINSVYADSSYQMELTYNYYNELKSAQPDEVVKAEVKKSINQYYVDIHRTQTIINKGIYLQVNHEMKVIILDSAKPSYYLALGISLDSLARFYDGVKFKALDSSTGQYTIPSRGKGIAYSTVTFDLKTYLLKEISIQFLDTRKSAKENALRNRLTIKYERMDMSPRFGPQSFSQSEFIYKEGSGFKVKKAYSKYRLVSNL